MPFSQLYSTTTSTQVSNGAAGGNGCENWVVPNGIFRIFAEVYGGGARGEDDSGDTVGSSGGGGGGVSMEFLNVVPGQNLRLDVGRGGGKGSSGGGGAGGAGITTAGSGSGGDINMTGSVGAVSGTGLAKGHGGGSNGQAGGVFGGGGGVIILRLRGLS